MAHPYTTTIIARSISHHSNFDYLSSDDDGGSGGDANSTESTQMKNSGVCIND